MFASVAVALAVGATAYAAPSFNTTIPRGCASHISEEQIQAAEMDFSARRARLSTVASIGTTAVASIPVVWHVIYGSESLADGYVPDSQIEASITDMNEHYAGTGLSFQLTKTTRTQNAAWFKEVGPDEQNQTDMKESLREGGPETLNVYTVGFQSGSGQGLLGYATFPSWYTDAPKDDGVVLLYSSVPGGSSTPYDEGKTLTHEVGHWIGLYHVFQGGCSGSGDMVADTPPQSTATSGCPTGQDSCPGGGVDSVHNFMDYSYDACMYEWTPGQITRAVEQMAAYRDVEFSPDPTASASTSASATTSATTSTRTSTSATSTRTSTRSSSTTIATTTSSSNCPSWWPTCPWANLW